MSRGDRKRRPQPPTSRPTPPTSPPASTASATCPRGGRCGGSWDIVKVGYKINFTRYFYQPQPLRTPGEIWADIRALERESEGLLSKIFSTEGVRQ